MTISQITHTMTEDAISDAPTMPQSSDPDTFDARGDAAMIYIGDMADEYNPMIAELNDVITDVNTTITGINTTVTEVSASASTSAANANFKGNWSDQTGAAAIPYSVLHSSKSWQLVSNLADVTAVEPGVTAGWATYWTDITSVGLDANVFTGQQTFKETKDTTYSITDGAAFEIDPGNGNIQTITLGADRTPLATNFEAGQCILLGIDDGTTYGITWTGLGVTWTTPGGTAAAPALAETGFTWVMLWMQGATIFGCEAGQI